MQPAQVNLVGRVQAGLELAVRRHADTVAGRAEMGADGADEPHGARARPGSLNSLATPADPTLNKLRRRLQDLRIRNETLVAPARALPDRHQFDEADVEVFIPRQCQEGTGSPNR